ncbi:MAG: class I SAM-dependent methyltransferase [Burkholderiales bacterium]
MTLAKQNPGLPLPPATALALSARLHALIRAEIAAAGGWISFARFMELALYAPGLGYYSAGSRKLGPAGDFITAPELSPLFGRALARQLAELVRQGLDDILELGAGSGALAETVLAELAALDCLPQRYAILELGADLRQRQQQRLMKAAPQIADRVTWLETLPQTFSGVVLGNEVLDAIPAHRIRKSNDIVFELGVSISGNDLEWAVQPASARLAAAAAELDLADDYETELNPAAATLIGDLARRLKRGVLLFIDYGFPAHEYYHPQRNRGTLMCHYRHHAHADPFLWVGLQDITAHVDFSAIARSGIDAGLELLGYTNQAQFLINCGITGLLAEIPASDTARYAPLAAQAQKLLSPAEMGELFKIIALGRGVEPPLLGFCSGDKSRTL